MEPNCSEFFKYRQRMTDYFKRIDQIEFIGSRNKTPDSICCCCERLFFIHSLTKFHVKKLFVSYIKKSKKNEDKNLSLNTFKKKVISFKSPFICLPCFRSLDEGNIPKNAICNGIEFKEIPRCIQKLTPLEIKLVSPCSCFTPIRYLKPNTLDPQLGVRGCVIHIPVKIQEPCKTLPKSPNDLNKIDILFESYMDHYKLTHLHDALEYLVHTPLYYEYSIKIDPSFSRRNATKNYECTKNVESSTQMATPKKKLRNECESNEAQILSKNCLVGIQNTGTFCYAISVIQALFSINKIDDYFVESRIGANLKRFHEYYQNFTSYNSSLSLREIIKTIPHDWTGQQDAAEYLSILFTKCCLDKGIKNDSEITNLGSISTCKMLSKIICKKPDCNFEFENSIGNTSIVLLAIPTVNKQQLNHPNIQQLLNECENFQTLEGYSCKSCNEETCLTKVEYFPQNEVMIFQIMLFESNLEKIFYNGKLNLNLSVHDKNFEIKAVIAHKGSDIRSGHYVCWRKVDSDWFLCDDSVVMKDKEPNLSERFKAFTPYILFYYKTENNSIENIQDIQLCPDNNEFSEKMGAGNDKFMDADDDIIHEAMVLDKNFKIKNNSKLTSWLKFPHLIYILFPQVFVGCAMRPTVKLSYPDLFKSFLQRRDRRACFPEFVLFAAKFLMEQRSKTAMRKTIDTRNVTTNRSQTEKLMQEEQSFKIFKTVKNSSVDFYERKCDLFAFLRQDGCPHMFITLSLAEYFCPELLQSLYQLQYKKKISKTGAFNLNQKIKSELIKNDPVTCVRYFITKTKSVFKLMESSDGPFEKYVLENYYIRYEFQTRGFIQLHALLWLKNFPVYNENNQYSIKNFIDFVDNFVFCKFLRNYPQIMGFYSHKHNESCYNGNGFTNKECRLGFPRWPMNKTIVLKPLTIAEKTVRIKQNVELIEGKLDFYSKSKNYDTFDVMLKNLNLSQQDYLQAARYSIKKQTLFLRREPEDINMNSYNPMMFLWEANTDHQPIIDLAGCVSYGLNYMVNEEFGVFQNMIDAKKSCEKENADLREQFKKVNEIFINPVLMSPQEAVMYVLGIPIFNGSKDVIWINTFPKIERIEILKSAITDPNSKDVRAEEVVKKYCQRNKKKYEHYCLADFATQISFKKQNKVGAKSNANDLGQVENKKHSKILKYKKCKKEIDELDYYRQQLMLFLPWRNEQKDLDSIDVALKYYNNKDKINKNYAKYSTVSEDDLERMIKKAEDDKKEFTNDCTSESEVDISEKISRDILKAKSKKLKKNVDAHDSIKAKILKKIFGSKKDSKNNSKSEVINLEITNSEPDYSKILLSNHFKIIHNQIVHKLYNLCCFNSFSHGILQMLGNNCHFKDYVLSSDWEYFKMILTLNTNYLTNEYNVFNFFLENRIINIRVSDPFHDMRTNCVELIPQILEQYSPISRYCIICDMILEKEHIVVLKTNVKLLDLEKLIKNYNTCKLCQALCEVDMNLLLIIEPLSENGTMLKNIILYTIPENLFINNCTYDFNFVISLMSGHFTCYSRLNDGSFVQLNDFPLLATKKGVGNEVVHPSLLVYFKRMESSSSSVNDVSISGLNFEKFVKPNKIATKYNGKSYNFKQLNSFVAILNGFLFMHDNMKNFEKFIDKNIYVNYFSLIKSISKNSDKPDENMYKFLINKKFFKKKSYKNNINQNVNLSVKDLVVNIFSDILTETNFCSNCTNDAVLNHIILYEIWNIQKELDIKLANKLCKICIDKPVKLSDLIIIEVSSYQNILEKFEDFSFDTIPLEVILHENVYHLCFLIGHNSDKNRIISYFKLETKNGLIKYDNNQKTMVKGNFKISPMILTYFKK